MPGNTKKDSLCLRASAKESQEQFIRRFTKKVRNSGLVDELMLRKYYEKPSVKRRRKKSKNIFFSDKKEK